MDDPLYANGRKSLLYICLAVCVTALYVIASYLMRPTIVLEPRYTKELRVVELSSRPTCIVRVSGLSLSSVYSADKFTAQAEGQSLNLLVFLSLSAPWRTVKRFQYDVTVPESVNEIRFGKSKEVIWRRGPNLQIGTQAYSSNYQSAVSQCAADRSSCSQ